METRPAPSTAIFCIFTGSLMLVMWILLIVTGKISELSEHTISLIFHWTAELATAVLLVLSGIGIYRHAISIPPLLPLSLGMLLNAVQGMFWYYTFRSEFMMAVPGAFLTGATLVYIFLNLKKNKDWVLFLAGLVDYGGINVIGTALDTSDTNTVIYLVIPVIVSLTLTFVLLRRYRSKITL